MGPRSTQTCSLWDMSKVTRDGRRVWDLDLLKLVHFGICQKSHGTPGPVRKWMVGIRLKEHFVLLLGFTSDFTLL